VAGGHSDSIFRAITDAIQVSKMYWRYVDQTMKPITFPEAFYMATLGGGAFFGAVGSFAEGYAFDAVVLDDTALVHPQELSVSERLERAVYLGLDTHGIRAKYVNGEKIIF
jgi:guanine deaminase